MHAPPRLAPAFDVIRQRNPDLYARMDASGWVLDDGAQADATMFLAGAEAATNGNRTMFSLTMTAMSAKGLGVPADQYRAAVLAHEFEHVSQDFRGGPDTMELERPAFAAMTAMAVTLPPPYGARIIAAVDELAASAERGETAYVVSE